MKKENRVREWQKSLNRILEEMERMDKLIEDTEKKIDDKQWIDLCIDNLPDRFFTRDDIEIAYGTVYGFALEKDYTDTKERPQIIEGIQEGIKYKYRIKQLESIRITREIAEKIGVVCINGNTYKYKDGRKVEIID